MKKIYSAIMAASLVAAMNANASVTISGSALSGLTAGTGDPAAESQYVAGTPDVWALSTPDSGLNGDSPAVKVKADVAGPLGNLNNFNASYTLSSPATGPLGTSPYFLTYLNAPGGGYVGVISFGGPDLNSSSQIHVIYSGATDTGDYWGDTLSTLDGLSYEGTTFGQLSVYETIIEIGDWNNNGDTIAASANIDSITIGAPVPEPTTIIAGALLLLPFGLSAVRRMRKQSQTN